MSNPAAPAEAVPTDTSARPFFGWRVLGACFTAQFISASVTFAPFGTFVIPIIDEFGTSRAQINSVFSIAFVGMGVLGPLVGMLLDRGHVRAIMLSGLVLNAAALILISRAESLVTVGALFVAAACFGGAFYGMTPTMWLATQWFARRRGLALGITVAGATVASMVATPVAAGLIGHIGWRGAVSVLGTAALVLGIPVLARYAIARPEKVGQYPDGDPAPEPDRSWGADDEAHAGQAGGELETSELVRDPRLWMLAIGFALIFTSPIVAMVALVPFGQELGLSQLDAAYFFTAAGPFSLLSKIAFGWASDRLPPRVAIWLVALFNGASWGLLILDPSYTVFLIIGALYGIGIGASGPLQALVVARCFGPMAFGRAMGIGGLAGLPVIAAAPAIAGFLADSTGSYHAAFQMEVAAMLIGGLLLSIPRIPKA